jgi:hypothetical protein
VIVVKTLNEFFAEAIFNVLIAAIPQMNMPIDNEYLFAGFSSEHDELSRGC